MGTRRILLCMAHMSGNEMKYIDEAFEGSWVQPLGPNVDGFEEDLRRFLSHDDPSRSHIRVAAVSAGTAAIHLGLILAGVKAGDEVICQSFTFAASANPVVYQGATPVFVDSEPDTWNMDPELLDRAIADRVDKTGRRPAAIIPVHLYGMPAPMDEILAVARRWDIPVVEDAAEALGSTYHGHACGTLGTYGALSFNGNKMITTSGGGALVCPDDESRARAVFFATQAREPYPYYQHEHIGYNYRMSNISAGIGRGQMTILDEHIAHHRHLADLYASLLKDVDGIDYHACPLADAESNYWLSTVTFTPDAISRGLSPEHLRQRLADLGIESRRLWKPMHLQPVFASAPAYINGVSQDLFDRGLCLPSGPWVTDEDIRTIVNEIIRYFAK